MPKVTATFDALTTRQKTIAMLVAEGKTSKHIARELAISPLTVRTHRRNLFRLLDVHSVAELVQIVSSLRRPGSSLDTPTE